MVASPIIDSDFFLVSEFLDDDDRALVAKVRHFVEDAVLPVINEAWENADFPWEVRPRYAELQIAGSSVRGYGCPGLSRLQTGLIAMELARGDGSINTFHAVHSGLAMGSIDLLGSEEQKQRWLPDMARVDALGAFALTEPDHGSDSVALETTAERHGDHYVLNGAKRWIGLGHQADRVIVWARDTADGKVKGFVVEKRDDGTYPDGYDARAITGKVGKRAVQQAHITLTGVRVPVDNLLAKCQGFRDVNKVLNRTRSTVAWEGVGHAVACYEAACAYVQQRVQFGQPIANFQLVQNSLANMLADLTAMQLMVFRTATFQDEDRLTNEQASLSKMFVCQKARTLCRNARDLFGGNGILLENHVARHLLDMEVLHTYEGTDFIQSLIVGRAITGASAFT